MNKEKSIAMCAIGVIAIMLVIIFATVLIYEKNTQTIEVEKSIKNRTNLVKKAKSEKATCYVDGKKQDEDFDPEGLSVDNYEVEYLRLPELCVAKRTGNMRIAQEQTGQLRFA